MQGDPVAPPEVEAGEAGGKGRHIPVQLRVRPVALAEDQRRAVGVIARRPLEQLGHVHGMSSTLPVVLRPSSARCASATSFNGNSNSIRSFSLPSRIQPSTSPARCTSSSRVAVYANRLGRVRKSEPLAPRMPASNGGTGPLD